VKECGSDNQPGKGNAMTLKIALAAGLLSLITCEFAQAQTTTAPAAKPAAAAAEKVKPAAKPRTARSLECSKEADAKNIHGKERKTFMSTCKKGSGKTS
jgi:hypothetical protein